MTHLGKASNLRVLFSAHHHVFHHEAELVAWIGAVKDPPPLLPNHSPELLHISCCVGDYKGEAGCDITFNDLQQ